MREGNATLVVVLGTGGFESCWCVPSLSFFSREFYNLYNEETYICKSKGEIKMLKDLKVKGLNAKEKKTNKPVGDTERVIAILTYTLDQIKDEVAYIQNSKNEEVNTALIDNIGRSAMRGLELVGSFGTCMGEA